MFRVLDIDPEGHAVSRADSLDEWLRPPPAGQFRFVDCVGPVPDELHLLQERFGFHPVAIEDCGQYDERPKLEVYEDHLFIVIHSLKLDPSGRDQLDAQELHTFLSTSYLVTVHDGPIEAVDAVRKRILAESNLARRSSAYFYYLIADSVMASVFPWIEDTIERIEAAEDGLHESSSAEVLNESYRIRRLLTSIRRVLAPQRDVFAALNKLESPILGKKITPFFRSLHGDILRLTELVETAREQASNLREAYLTNMSQRTNEVVKRLTVLSAVFLPLTFLTGFFGQNFEALPFGSRGLFYGALATTAAVPAAMLIWFRRSGWW